MTTIKERLSLISPTTWPVWFGISILWTITRLPYRVQHVIGQGIGKLIYLCGGNLRRISEKNIELCFPDWTAEQRKTLLQKNFEALGIGILETGTAWWSSDRRLEKCAVEISGIEHVENAFARGKGIILLGPHCTCLEMVGRLLGAKYSFAVTYKPHKKQIVARILERFRQKYRVKTISTHHMRELLRTLEQNMAVWYAYDVDAGEKRSVFAPLFGIQTASLTAVSRIVKMSDTAIVPIDFHRMDDKWGYHINLAPAIENFPSDDLSKDAERLNACVEASIRTKPEQYIWQYKRFKTRPKGEKRFY